MLRRLVRPASALLVAALAAGPAAAEVYRWVDENGTTHYTLDPEEIPARLRSQIGDAPPAEPLRPAVAPRAVAPPNDEALPPPKRRELPDMPPVEAAAPAREAASDEPSGDESLPDEAGLPPVPGLEETEVTPSDS